MFITSNRTRATGLALWLTMLSTARAQAHSADDDTPPFLTLHKWKYIDFTFPTTKHRMRALFTGKYVPSNVIPLGVEVWGSRVWVSLPRWRRGVPATLATVPRVGGYSTTPLMKPYPNWAFHGDGEGKNCKGLTSVFRMNVDDCGRLWVMDTGVVDTADNPKQLCPPSIVVFDLETDSLLARYPIPRRYVQENSLFSNILVDSRTSDCSDLHAYIADTWRFNLLVFREQDHSFWRFSHHLFYPEPFASNYSLHGTHFQWSDGIIGLALTPINRYTDRMLIFHAMSSFNEFYVPTSVLRDPSRVNDSTEEFQLLGGSRGFFGQSSASYIDKRGVMFYGLVTQDSVGCWNSRKLYKKKTLGTVAQNSETLVFPNDVKVDHEEPQNVWVLSNKLPMFQEGSLNMDDYNYRILYSDVNEAVKGTVCDPLISF